MVSSEALFSKVLVANRGEIACRIMRTLGELGIASLAVYHASERRARHVGLADEAVEVAGATPVEAYLDAAQIVEAARRCGADAIHPGYGFLSENADFARRVSEAGLTFVGPDAGSIALMGDKIESRRFAEAEGVPVAPSVMATDDMQAFLAAAEKIGFPLLIKAAAGGGGKGMSIVRRAAELEERASVAAGEAKRYFGDSRIYAERYLEWTRHIEVQVVGDGAGAALHLFERECSVQRRFQKVVEEAPAPGLSAALRQQICAAAVKLASAAKYRNLGTVEFILAPDGRFYFLEMNTRLQVEHPVTEMITGLDLVRLQLEIAAGRPIAFRQEELVPAGHAIECRICAEDPEQDFLPQTGSILALEPAAEARFDSGLLEGQAVTADFDPMLAKLVVQGADRTAAIEAAIAALRRTVLLGVGTNLDYLARVLDHPDFRAGLLHTGFLAEHAADLRAVAPATRDRDLALLAAILSFREFQTLAFDTPDPYASIGAWRN